MFGRILNTSDFKPTNRAYIFFEQMYIFIHERKRLDSVAWKGKVQRNSLLSLVGKNHLGFCMLKRYQFFINLRTESA